MAQPVKLGVIGCGDVMTAYMAHARELLLDGLVEVTWACDSRRERGEAMQQRYGVPHFTSEGDELLVSAEVDAVLVLTLWNHTLRLRLPRCEPASMCWLKSPWA